MDFTAAEWEELLVDIEKVQRSWENQRDEPGVEERMQYCHYCEYTIDSYGCTIETKGGKLIVEFDDGQPFVDWECKCRIKIYEDFKVLVFKFHKSTPIIADVDYRVEFDLNGKVRTKQ